MEHTIGFHIPIVDGPSVEDLTHAADALYRANHPRKPSCAEINAAAIARGEYPPYKDDDDNQLRYVTLAMAQLRFAYKSGFIKKRYFRVYATKIVHEGDYYTIYCKQTFTYKRNLVANNGDVIRLYPREPYDFVIRYNAKLRGGRIKSIARSYDPNDKASSHEYPLD